MKIAHADETPRTGGRNVRAGTLEARNILTGEPGSPDNFVMGLYYQSGDFHAPRHRHNFDHWRYQIAGEVGFGEGGAMTPGTLTYFPEGANYGPNTGASDGAENVVALVQFGGPSGEGFLSLDEVFAAAEDLKAFGRFENGVFHRNEGVPGKATLDAFQATWEHAMGRPLAYPQPSYPAAIMMDTATYAWQPLAGAPGVEQRVYGTYTECAIRGASYRLAPGASFEATGRGIYFVLSGTGAVAGTNFRTYTAVYLECGERTTFRASEPAELLLMGLPEIARKELAEV